MGIAGYDSVMTPFGVGAGKERPAPLKPGDKLPDGRVFGSGMADMYKKQLGMLNQQAEAIQAQIASVEAKLAALTPVKEAAAEEEPVVVEPKVKGSFTVTKKRRKVEEDVDTGDSE